MATIRERRPGVWEVRVFTGRGEDGRPTQVSRTVRGGKRLTIDSSVVQRHEADGDSELVDDPTKTANRRTVHFDPATVAEVRALRDHRHVVSRYLFSYNSGPAPASRIGWLWTRARTLAGLDPPWRFHDLRIWSATVAISGGTDMRTVAGRLGHANERCHAKVPQAAIDTVRLSPIAWR